MGRQLGTLISGPQIQKAHLETLSLGDVSYLVPVVSYLVPGTTRSFFSSLGAAFMNNVTQSVRGSERVAIHFLLTPGRKSAYHQL